MNYRHLTSSVFCVHVYDTGEFGIEYIFFIGLQLLSDSDEDHNC